MDRFAASAIGVTEEPNFDGFEDGGEYLDEHLNFHEEFER